MKNYVTDFDLTAAFKALDEIDYEKPEGGLTANRNILNESITDRKGRKTTQSRTLNVERLVEDYYDLGNDQDLNQAAEDRDGDIAQAKLARIEKIVDLDAKTADDLLPSYVGKVIIQCPQCMNLFYKNEEDLVKDEEDPTTCNVNEPCQHCGNISGYTIIGKVDKLDANDQADLGLDAAATDLNLEEVPVDNTTEEVPAENTEAPAEGGEADLDLDLDLDLEEPAQESLNRSKAAKSDFASVNTSKLTTLNEEVDPELDKKLAAHDSYIDYLRNEIESLEAALKNEKNDEIKAAKEAHLAELQQALEEALPDAVKNAPSVDEFAADEAAPEETPAETPEGDAATVGAEDLPTDDVQESLKEGAHEDEHGNPQWRDGLYYVNKMGYFDFMYKRDAEDALKNFPEYIKSKKNGKAVGKELEMVEVPDGYRVKVKGLSVKESINESLEENVLTELVNKIPANLRADLAVATDPAEGEDARDVVGDISFDFNFDEDTIAKATELVNAVLSNLDTTKYSYQIWNPSALSTEGCQSIDEVVKEATEQNETDMFDEDGYLNISIYENESAVDESLNKSKAQKDAEEKSDLATDITSEHKSLQEGSAAQMLAAFEASLDDDSSVDESVNKAEIDANTVPENASENKSINECDGKACQECDGAACEAKPEDNLDEAVAITIGVEEVDDTVTPTPDTMIIAEPETDTTAVYTPDSAEPTISIDAQPVEVEENPFGSEFDAEYDDEPDVDPFDQDFDDYEEESDEDDDDDDDDGDSSDEDNAEAKEADDEDDEDDDKKDESLKESLQEGIWDKVKAAGKAIAGTAKNIMVGKGNILDKYAGQAGYSVINQFKELDPATQRPKTETKQVNTYAEAEKLALNSSNLNNVKQSLIRFNDTAKTPVNGFIGGKETNKGKELLDQAVRHAQASVNINGSNDLDVNNDESAAKANQNAQGQGATNDNVIDATWNNVPQDVRQKFDAWVNASKQLGMNQQAIENVKQHLLAYYGNQIGQNKQLGAPTQENLQEDLSAVFEEAINSLKATGTHKEAKAVKEDLETITNNTVAALRQLRQQADQIIANATAGANADTKEGLLAPDINVNLDASGQNNAVGMGASQPIAGTNVNPTDKPVEEGILGAVGDVVNGITNGVKNLLADNADDAEDAKDDDGYQTIADKFQTGGFGDEKPNDETSEVEEAVGKPLSKTAKTPTQARQARQTAKTNSMAKTTNKAEYQKRVFDQIDDFAKSLDNNDETDAVYTNYSIWLGNNGQYTNEVEENHVEINKALDSILDYINNLAPEDKAKVGLSWTELEADGTEGDLVVSVYDPSENEYTRTLSNYPDYESKILDALSDGVNENLQEDVSDAEFDKMLNSQVFKDFNEEINPDELEDIDEESVNECTTNYLKEVYSNVDKFELTRGDVRNGVLVLEGVIRFHSGAERTTTFGYNLTKGLNLKGINEDLAKDGEFVMGCTLDGKKLIAESLSYKYEVNGQLVEGLIRRK